jgi:plasmid stability protein
MSATLIQIRNVPRDLHRRVKARAAMEGLSMSEYALRELRKAVERPTREDVLRRLAAEAPTEPDPSPAEVIRAERDAR